MPVIAKTLEKKEYSPFVEATSHVVQKVANPSPLPARDDSVSKTLGCRFQIIGLKEMERPKIDLTVSNLFFSKKIF